MCLILRISPAQHLDIRTGVIFPDIKKVDQETCVNNGYLAFASIVVHKFESGKWKKIQGKYEFPIYPYLPFWYIIVSG